MLSIYIFKGISDKNDKQRIGEKAIKLASVAFPG